VSAEILFGNKIIGGLPYSAHIEDECEYCIYDFLFSNTMLGQQFSMQDPNV
jgi:hypothetical protein